MVESLFHAGTACDAKVNIKWVDSEGLTAENVGRVLGDCSGVLVPGGFGDRGIEGMILAAQYARENDVPYFGICLGMQIAVIEYARHCLLYTSDAADDLLCVDLGGRRIIKKKKQKKKKKRTRVCA